MLSSIRSKAAESGQRCHPLPIGGDHPGFRHCVKIELSNAHSECKEILAMEESFNQSSTYIISSDGPGICIGMVEVVTVPCKTVGQAY